jgi:hypothetical protein
MLYVKRIIAFNQDYGKFAFVMGIVFIMANAISAIVYFIIGKDFKAYDQWKSAHLWWWMVVFVPFYTITEFIPAVTFGVVMYKYHLVFNPEPVRGRGEEVQNNNEG